MCTHTHTRVRISFSNSEYEEMATVLGSLNEEGGTWASVKLSIGGAQSAHVQETHSSRHSLPPSQAGEVPPATQLSYTVQVGFIFGTFLDCGITIILLLKLDSPLLILSPAVILGTMCFRYDSLLSLDGTIIFTLLKVLATS